MLLQCSVLMFQLSLCFFLNSRIWGDFKIVAILPSSLILLCRAEWGGTDIGIGNPGHVFCAILAFNNFVVFEPLKEILHEVAIRKLHKKNMALIYLPTFFILAFGFHAFGFNGTQIFFSFAYLCLLTWQQQFLKPSKKFRRNLLEKDHFN